MYNPPMAQLNINVTPEFERDLRTFMKIRGVRQKSQAIRLALHELISRLKGTISGIDYRQLVWCAKGLRENPNPKFRSDDDLWN